MSSNSLVNFLSYNKKCFNISFSSSLHYFLLQQSLVVVVSTDTKYFTNNFYLSPVNWGKFFLLQKITTPSNLSIVVDGSQFKLSNLN